MASILKKLVSFWLIITSKKTANMSVDNGVLPDMGDGQWRLPHASPF